MKLLALTALLLALGSAATAAPETDPDSLLREHLWGQVLYMPKAQRPKVGLVLSGGAVRGLAHIGVLQVLEDAGFPIDMVAGTSMGAVVGSFYAAGMGMDRLGAIAKAIRLSTGSNLSNIRLLALFLEDRLLSTENLEKMVTREIGDKSFAQTPRPFACVAMDIRTGEKIIFREGALAPAVRASMNIPGLFKPVSYRHRYLVDGGVVDYIPVDAAKLLGADWVLASVTEGDFSRTVPTNVLFTLQQVIDIRGSLLARQQKREADFVIEPNVGDIEYYDVSHAQQVMGEGVAEARHRLNAAKEKFILFCLPRLMAQWTAQK